MNKKGKIIFIIELTICILIAMSFFVIYEVQNMRCQAWEHIAEKEGYEYEKGHIHDNAIVTIDGEEYQIIEHDSKLLAFIRSEYKVKEGGFAIYYTETSNSIYVESMPDAFYYKAGKPQEISLVEMHKILPYDEIFVWYFVIAGIILAPLQPLIILLIRTKYPKHIKI